MNDPSNGHSNLLSPSQLIFLGSFDDQVQELLSTIRLKKQDVERFTHLFNDLERKLQQIWAGCQVMPFGSVVSGLGILTSDVDCYVAMPQHINIDQKTCVILAKKALQKHYNLFRELFAITAAKVPIVKLYHVPTSTYCDVSFKSPAGVRNSSLLGFMLHLDPRALPLAVIVKYWAKVHKLTGTNMMSSYCLILLIIFYLQQKNILPTVYILQSTVPEHIIDGWNTSFDTTLIHTTNNDESLYELLGGFFDYFASFNFGEYVISPFSGYPISKSQFSNSKNVPEIFEDYIRNIEFGNYEELRLNTMFCVQDSFEHNRNCAAVVYPRLAKTILTYFKSASEAFKNKSECEYLREILEMKPDVQGINGKSIKKKKKNMQTKIINKAIVKAKHKTNYYNARRDIINKHIGYKLQGFKKYQNIHRR